MATDRRYEFISTPHIGGGRGRVTEAAVLVTSPTIALHCGWYVVHEQILTFQDIIQEYIRKVASQTCIIGRC